MEKNDLYKEFFEEAINSGIALIPKLKEIAQKISAQKDKDGVNVSVNNDVETFKAQLCGNILAKGKTVVLPKSEKIVILKENLRFVDRTNLGEILQSCDDCLNDKEFLEILAHFLHNKLFRFYSDLHKRGCYFKYLTFWLNVGGQIELADIRDFAAFEQGENEHLEELINLYKSKGNKISDEDVALFKLCRKRKKIVYKWELKKV